MSKAGRAHQRHVRPGNAQDACAPVRGGRDRADDRGSPEIRKGMRGKKIGQMGFHTDGAYSWSASSVRYAESLVQIEVADISSEIGRPAKTDLRIHVRAVHIHLTAVSMHDVADLDDPLLKDSMGRRIGNH